MIKLCLERYCQDCSYFEPEIVMNNKTIMVNDVNALSFHHEIVPVEKTVCDTSVYCKHRVRCESIITNFKTT